VSGNGIVYVEPDSANVRLGVEVVRTSAQAAQNDNAKLMQKVIAAITSLGIEKDKIQTAGFNIWPEIKYETNQSPKTVGYRCSNQINITLNDLKKTSAVIDNGLNAGANNIQGIQFSRKDVTEAKKLALEKAVKEAADKAHAIAAAAGMKIINIKNISEGNTSLQPIQANDMGLKAMAVSGNETPIASGLIAVQGSVTISYSAE
jgi:hypothetical protein